MAEIGILHERKSAVLLGYAKLYNCVYFVETGTAYGEMTQIMQGKFRHIFTIELGAEFHERAKNMFSADPGITVLLGDSGKVLKSVMPRLDAPALFWLDAHYSGGATSKGDQETPILDELESILAVPSHGHVIVIDDLSQFMWNPEYPRIETLRVFIETRCLQAEINILHSEGMIVVKLPGNDNHA